MKLHFSLGLLLGTQAKGVPDICMPKAKRWA